jgi:hypothetical protein
MDAHFPIRYQSAKVVVAVLTTIHRDRNRSERAGNGEARSAVTYLHTLLIRGARAVARFAEKNAEPDSWLRKLMMRLSKNVAVVAQANKNTGIVRALLAKDRIFLY